MILHTAVITTITLVTFYCIIKTIKDELNRQ